MRVEAYYNLHKHCISFRPPGGRVEHAKSLMLENVSFAVQPAGREKVRATGRKNVHAFVRGDRLWSTQEESKLPTLRARKWVKIVYNPYKYESFMAETEGGLKPVTQAWFALIRGKEVYAVLDKPGDR